MIRLGRKKPKYLTAVLRGVNLYLQLLACAGIALTVSIPKAAAAPVPCQAAGTCGTGPGVWVTSGKVTAPQGFGGKLTTIQQESDKAILNWASFNVGADEKVEFLQPNEAAIALNRIFQADASRIEGQVSANGQIYLINHNGILFGKGAQVNVHGLVASTLNIDDYVFDKGIVSKDVKDETRPAFAGEGAAVTVEAGADIKAVNGGRIMLFGSAITNQGNIEANGGQVILGAGNKVFLAAAFNDPTLRGLVVEVDADAVSDEALQRFLKGEADPATGAPSQLASGTVTNTGTLRADRGNITLVGLAVNQHGRASATTSVNANGSVRLLARDKVEASKLTELGHTGTPTLSERAGLVDMGSASQITVLPELASSDTAVDEQQQYASTVEAMGQTIHMRSGSIIQAPGGNVMLTATEQPNRAPSEIVTRNNAQVYIESGATIDVSGSDVVLPMERNQLDVELRGSELKDSPMQRQGALRGITVSLDLRDLGDDKTIPIADISGALANIRRSVAERTSEGGHVAIASEGDVVVRENSTIDVSGGAIEYLPGTVKSTKLVSQGQIFDITAAPADRIYEGVLGSYTKTYKKWGVKKSWQLPGQSDGARSHPGYIEGKNAGTIQFAGYGMILDGTLRGQAVQGPLQRTPTQIPQGGLLQIGAPNVDEDYIDFRAPSVMFGANTLIRRPEYNETLPAELRDTLYLSPDYLANGFTRTRVFSNGRIVVPQDRPIQLAPGGTDGADYSSFFELKGAQVEVLADITAPGGKISFEVTDVASALAQAGVNRMVVGDGVALQAGGTWVNDLPEMIGGNPFVPATIDGGSVSVIFSRRRDGELAIGNNVRLDVSGGAWLKADRELLAGEGGSITIKMGQPEQGADFGLNIGDALALAGYALEQGGSLSLVFNDIKINGSATATGSNSTLGAQQIHQGDAVTIPSALFQNGGFSAYALTANNENLVVEANTQIQIQMQNRLLDPSYARQASGTGIDAISQIALLPDAERTAADLALHARQERNNPDLIIPELNIAAGAQIRGDATASISLSSTGKISMDGIIDAPAGTIALAIDNTVTGIYSPDRVLRIGPQAQLSVRGTSMILTDDLGLRSGEVYAGGDVLLEARGGYLITEAGSRIDVSGASDTVVVQTPSALASDTFKPEKIDTPAGRVTVTATEGVKLAGSVNAHSLSETAANGQFTLNFKRGDVARAISGTNNQYNDKPRHLVVAQDDVADANKTTPAEIDSQALVSATMLTQAGFDSVYLQSSDQIDFNGNVSAHARRSISLDAPLITSTESTGGVELSAGYVLLGPGELTVDISPAAIAKPGAGQLLIHADLIDVRGDIGLQGFNDVTLQSATDIRLRGLFKNGEVTGQVAASGNLTLSADQIYPTTLSRFSIFSADVAPAADQQARLGTVTIQGGDAHRPVLSAGGQMLIEATVINQGGVLKAPFGSIELRAPAPAVNSEAETASAAGDNSVISLMPGSLTSTSAEQQLIPLGVTVNANVWRLGKLEENAITLYDEKTVNIPQQRLRVTGANVQFAEGAVIDMTGGGDMLAREFLPGPNGSKDVLSADYANTQGLFAVVPGLAYAPVEEIGNANWQYQPGDSVYLAGGNGLAAGQYAILPAQYALLPGAYLVTRLDGYRDLLPEHAVNLGDGTPITAGYQTVHGSPVKEARRAGYVIRPGSYLNELAEYRKTVASDFIGSRTAESAVLLHSPTDAGRLVIAGTKNIALDGMLRAQPAVDGKGASIDIVAPELRIIATPAVDGGTGVQLRAEKLNMLGAQSLSLGAERIIDTDGIRLNVGAESITIGSGVELNSPDLWLTARDKLHVETNTHLAATGPVRSEDSSNRETVTIEGDSALLRISAAPQIELARQNVTAEKGALQIDDGSVLTTAGSLMLDATGAMQSSAAIDMSGGSLALGASKITVGGTQKAEQGLWLSQSQLQVLAGSGQGTGTTLDELILKSASDIELVGPVTMSANTMTLDAAAITSRLSAAEKAQLNAAETLTLTNTQSALTPSQNGGGGGSLEMQAQRLELAGGNYAIHNFTDVKLVGQTEIVAKDEGALTIAFTAPADSSVTSPLPLAALTLDAPRITGDSGATLDINASGDVRLLSAEARPDARAEGVGASISITGNSIYNDALIDLPSGITALHAQGPAGSVVVDTHAIIDVSGITKTFDDVQVGSPGGIVELKADVGALAVNPGATINVSGNTVGGDAGKLLIAAPQGNVSLAGNLQGSAQADARQGTFQLNAGTLGNSAGGAVDQLNKQLDAGGFTARREFRLHRGDIVITNPIKANYVKVTADGENNEGGTILLVSVIDASGEKGGDVYLNAQRDVILHGRAQILARASTDNARGGHVELSADDGYIDIKQGARIDVGDSLDGNSRDPNSADGDVLLRARRLDLNELDLPDVQVRAIAGDILNSQRTVVEAFKVYDEVVDNSLAMNWQMEATSFVTQAAAINARLDPTGKFKLVDAQGNITGSALHLRPGIEIRTTQDFNLNNVITSDISRNTWDFSSPYQQWRFWNGIGLPEDITNQVEPGVLTIRSASNLTVSADLTDGFKPSSLMWGQEELQAGDSWSYRLVAGADIASADPLAVSPPSRLIVAGTSDATGNLTVGINESTGGGVRIRTGTGRIDMAAGNDLILSAEDSVIYTAGVPGFATDALTNPSFLIDFPAQGGDVNIYAQRDLVGVDSEQFFSHWLFRQGNTDTATFPEPIPTQWGVVFSNFKQNIGALGGGDISIAAGRDIDRIAAVIPTTGRQMSAEAADLQKWGGGDLDIEAGQHIKGGMFYVSNGDARLVAHDSIIGGRNSGDVNVIMGMGEGSVALTARRELAIESIVNPTVLVQAAENNISPQSESYFFTYNQQSSAVLTSLAGEIILRPATELKYLFSSIPWDNGGSDKVETLQLLPPNLRVVALENTISIKNDLTLFPSAIGSLDLFANKTIEMANSVDIVQSGIAPGSLPTLSNPKGGNSFDFTLITNAAAEKLHINDPDISRIIANNGNIEGAGIFTFAEPVRVIAGRDINVAIGAQNLRNSDVTLISAGRDIKGTESSSVLFIEVAGPGRLEVVAGRNIDLGASVGVKTIGNFKNLALAEYGADINVMAGAAVKPDYRGFVQRYLLQDPYYGDFIQGLKTASGKSELTGDEALSEFEKLPEFVQRELVLSPFFNELLLSGREATATQSKDYSRGKDAIAALFPGEHQGDLSMLFSQIYTLDGGDIQLLVPGGKVDAGAANYQGNSKTPSQLGIVTQGPGNIRAYSLGDFMVNQSRVFTLQGGDILMWSADGNIDAGRGAKTAISAPEPNMAIRDDGTIEVTFAAAIAGSGIRGILTRKDIEPGDVDLIAPRGEVNAGDAGIGSAGNLNIAAARVVGADNIQVAGVATGVPAADTGSIAAGLTGVTNAASSVTKNAEDSLGSFDTAEEPANTPLANAALSFLEVFVVGFGEDEDEKNKEKNK